jgi:hypothetical protein
LHVLRLSFNLYFNLGEIRNLLIPIKAYFKKIIFVTYMVVSKLQLNRYFHFRDSFNDKLSLYIFIVFWIWTSLYFIPYLSLFIIGSRFA